MLFKIVFEVIIERYSNLEMTQYLYDFFSLFLGVQSALEVGPTSYETPCIIT